MTSTAFLIFGSSAPATKRKRPLQDPEEFRQWKLRLEASERESERAWMEWRYDHPIFIRLKATGEILTVIV